MARKWGGKVSSSFVARGIGIQGNLDASFRNVCATSSGVNTVTGRHSAERGVCVSLSSVFEAFMAKKALQKQIICCCKLSFGMTVRWAAEFPKSNSGCAAESMTQSS